jgi:hypothetical protein
LFFHIIKILYISLLFLLSLLSYVLVERPFRKKNNFHFKKVIFIFGSLIFILLSSSSYFLFSNGLNQRFSKAISVVYEDKIALNPSSKIDIVYNRDGKSGNVVLIGDSIAQSLVINLNEELKKKDYNLFYFDTYFYINGFDRINSINKFRIKGFIDNNKKIENFLEKNHNLIIILSNEWSSKINKLDYHNNKEQVENKLLRNKSHTDSYFIPILENIHNYNSYEYFVSNFILTINNLTRNNNKLILIYPVPSFNYDVTRFLNSSLLFKKVKGGEDKIQILSENYQFYKDNNKEIFDIFDGIKNPNIFRVYPDKLFCNSKILNHCVANSETEVFFRDNSHLTFLGSKYLVSNILGVINKIK